MVTFFNTFRSNFYYKVKEDEEEKSKDLAEKEESNDVESDVSTNHLENYAEKSEGIKLSFRRFL